MSFYSDPEFQMCNVSYRSTRMTVNQTLLPLLTALLLVSCTHIKVFDSESLHIDTSANLPEATLLDIVITTLDPLLEDLDPELGPLLMACVLRKVAT